MIKGNVLLVDDDKDIVESMEIHLKNEGLKVYKAYDGIEALEILLEKEIHLILMDIMMPRMDGLSATLKIREEKNIPIILVSAKTEDSDKIIGLNMGADDYITKPFHIQELVARVKVVLKRKVNIENTDILEYDDLKLDIRTGKMSANGNEISINGKELDLLETLLLNKTQIVNREILANKIWGYDSDAEYNNVEVYVSFLRKKLKILQSNVMIKAVRGIGYKLDGKVEK